MNPVTQQPGGNAKMVCSLDGHRDWSSGLFGCFEDCKTCIMVCFCLPCTLCRMSSKLGECPLMPYCVSAGVLAMRARLRTLGGIRGSICNDCMVLYFCGACAICQMAREMDEMGL